MLAIPFQSRERDREGLLQRLYTNKPHVNRAIQLSRRLVRGDKGLQGRATEDQKEILGMRESQVMLSWVDDQTKRVCKSRIRKGVEN